MVVDCFHDGNYHYGEDRMVRTAQKQEINQGLFAGKGLMIDRIMLSEIYVAQCPGLSEGILVHAEFGMGQLFDRASDPGNGLD